MKDLTNSAIDRQNILNNPEALSNIQSHLGITGMLYEDEYRFTTAQIADYYNVSIKTIRRQIDVFGDELSSNGYVVLKGQKLKEFKILFNHLLYKDIDNEDSQRDIDVPLSKDNGRDVNDLIQNTVKEKQSLNRLKALAIFNFRAFLNIGMLLTDSEKAKALRSTILDIVIDSLNQKFGGTTKYVNQRDSEFLTAIAREPKYRKEFTSALSRYLEMGNEKYSVFTDEIYKAIFHEKASEYKEILKLEVNENVRDTMYAEVLNLIASFEIGIADEMKEQAEGLKRRLSPDELITIIQKFASKRHWMPQLEDARTKMASRDYCFREAIHPNLQSYVKSLSPDEYDKFLGDKNHYLLERIIENPELLDVFKRLKDR